MSNLYDIEETIFSEPSGNTRGQIIAYSGAGNKSRCIAVATLLTDKDPSINLRLSKGVTISELKQIIVALSAFSDAIDTHTSTEKGQ